MYLHIGQSVVVPEAAIIGIFDLDNTTGSRMTREFLSEAEKKGRITVLSDELPKSFVVCDGGANMDVYLSQLSPATLMKRGLGNEKREKRI